MFWDKQLFYNDVNCEYFVLFCLCWAG